MESAQGERAVRALRGLQADARVSLVALAARMAIPYDRLYSYVSGRVPFPVERAPDLYRALLPIDRALALLAFSELVGLREIGHEAKPLARATDGDEPATDALQAQHWLGDLSAHLASFGRNVDAYEAQEALPAARRLHVESGQLITKLEVIASITPQRSILSNEVRS